MSNRFAVGLDLSLTSSGIAAISLDDPTAMFTERVRSRGKKTDTLTDHLNRLDRTSARISELVAACDPAVVVVETAYFSTENDSSAHRRAGLWWAVVGSIERSVPIIDVAPAQLKKWLTGRGDATKDQMVGTVVNKWGRDVFAGEHNDDRADALAAASLGACILGVAVPHLDMTDYRKAVVETFRQRERLCP